MDLQRINLKKGIVWVKGKRGWRKVFLGEASQHAILAYLDERPQSSSSALWLSVHRRPLTSDGVRQMVDRLAHKANVHGRTICTHSVTARPKPGWTMALTRKSLRRHWDTPM